MRSGRAGVGRWLAALLSLSLWTGCAAIPVTGPVMTEPRSRSGQNDSGVAIAPGPPPQGASVADIVDGFLLAMATFEPDYVTARLYLTDQAAQSWSPESEVLIYGDDAVPRVVDNQVTISAPIIGRLDVDGAFAGSTDPRWEHDFGLVRNEAGEWRIARPPAGLALSHYLFTSTFVRVDAYFFDHSWSVLVPDSRYLPRGDWGLASAVEAVLAGPASWLAPIVTSAVQPDLRLNGPPSLDGSGLVDIRLNDTALELSTDQATLLAVQFAATLRQMPSVTAVSLTVGQTTQRTIVERLTIRSIESYDSVQTGSMALLYGLDAQGVVPLEGALPPGRPSAGSDLRFGAIEAGAGLALSADGQELAVATAGQVIRGWLVDAGTDRTVMEGSGLLRPQFGSDGQLWAMTSSPASTQLHLSQGETVRSLSPSGLLDRQVRSFCLSPDGQRMAVVAEIDGRLELGLLQVRRQSGQVVDLASWRPIRPLWESNALTVSDVSWVGSSALAIIAARPSGIGQAYFIDVDGVDVQELGRPSDAPLIGLATASRSGTTQLVVLDQEGGAWHYQDTHQWLSIGQSLVAVAYSG
ncbi:MAG: LpqB family beta-propeller domain-containing protein [Propionibacteriaceae bacterium]|jgi:hypothetical protein|nr:LpqB family beta-propeller domain-containing protein [Propionibacteriaceae bacterium]